LCWVNIEYALSNGALMLAQREMPLKPRCQEAFMLFGTDGALKKLAC